MTQPAADSVKVVWTGTGTGTVALGAVVPSFLAFPAGLNGEKVSYIIAHDTAAERETGIGTYTHSGTTLTRDFVSSSTNGGAKVAFSAGTKHVGIAVLALDVVENRATVDPTAAENYLDGYVSGRSRWLNTTTDKLWICLDDGRAAAGVAVWGRLVTADEIASLSLADNQVTNAKLADMTAWTIKVRNAGTSGDPTDAAAANINETVPESTDFVLGMLATGEIRKYQTGNLPAAAGSGEANTGSNIGTDGVGVFSGKVSVNLQFRNIAPASAKITTVLNGNDIDIGVDESNFAVPAANVTSGTFADARISASSVKQHFGLYDPVDGTTGGANITTITDAMAGDTIKFNQAIALSNSFGAGKWVILNNVHASTAFAITSAGGLINGASSYTIPAGGEIMLRCISNAGAAPQCDARGDATTVDLGGRVVSGNLVKVVTGVTGTLTTAAHLGCLIVTTGNITVPTTTGFHCLVKFGGAHTVTFNSTVAAAATTGQVASIVVQSSTVIIMTPRATPVVFS